VETVSDLERLRRTLADALGVRSGTITAHDFEFGMLLEPGGQSLCRAIR
jgi:hypothetical protein